LFSEINNANRTFTVYGYVFKHIINMERIGFQGFAHRYFLFFS